MDSNAVEPIHVDFDLILVDEVVNPPRAPVRNNTRTRPITATIIQEEGPASVIAAEQAASGFAIAIRD